MFYPLFKKLKLDENDLQPVEAPLVGFCGSPVWPIGRISIPLRAGSVTRQCDFVVVDAPSPYNAIGRRTWLHGMKAIASSFHQVVRFIGTSGKQEDIRRDQVASKACYVNSVQLKKNASRVNNIEVPEAPVLEDVGAKTEENVVEDLIKVPANEDGT